MESEDPLKGGDDSDVTHGKEMHQGSPHTPQLDSSLQAGVELEQVDPEEFAFLDTVTQQAALQSELDDVRQRLAIEKNRGRYVPLRLFRSWGQTVISVTDIVAGLWCEVQVEYKYLHKHLKHTGGWSRMAEQGRPVQLRTAEMMRGATIHLKKELEVHEVVQVKKVTKEDRWAVQLIDTYVQLESVKSRGLEREIAVFGDPFGMGILIKGIIDQLQYSPESGKLILLDYKTRRSNSLPSPEQKRGHFLQLMLYKCMLDLLLCGATPMNLLSQHANLVFDVPLTSGPIEHIQQCGLQSLLIGDKTQKVLFGEVAECISKLIAGLGLPLVSTLVVQYEYQASGEVLGTEAVEYDENWMKSELETCFSFWMGRRSARGVDIEETWKCDSCQFRDICVWRMQKELEKSPVAKSPAM